MEINQNNDIFILGDGADSLSIDLDFNGEDTINLSHDIKIINLYDADSVSPLDISSLLNNINNTTFNTNPWGNIIVGSGGSGGGSAGGGGSGGGYVYTTSGTGNLSWNQSNWPSISTSDTYPSLNVKGDSNFEGDIKIKGKSIADSLEKIEEKLAILRPNEQLEEKWEKLRELRNQYIELEKDIIEKEKIWETLKK